MKKQNGFTLIELMIVVAIIGILASIAYPSYQRYMLESRRSDAHIALLSMADAQERFFLQNNFYTTDVTQVGNAASLEGFYTLAVTAADANSYTLTAIPVAGSAQAQDVGCEGTAAANTITLTSARQKTPATCWR